MTYTCINIPHIDCYCIKELHSSVIDDFYLFYDGSVKVALGVCFALKSLKEYLLLFTYLITLGKDVTLPLITKFKTNK